MRQALLSVLHLFTLFVFFLSGLFLLAVPVIPRLQLYFESLLLQRPETFSYAGLAFLLAGFILWVGFYGLSRGQYLHYRCGQNRTKIEAHLVRQTLEEFLKHRFSDEICLVDVEIIRSKIQIGVSLPVAKKESLLPHLEQELVPFLEQRFGYNKPFDLIIKAQ